MKKTGRRSEVVGGLVSCRLRVSLGFFHRIHVVSHETFWLSRAICIIHLPSSIWVVVFCSGVPRRTQDAWPGLSPSWYRKNWKSSHTLAETERLIVVEEMRKNVEAARHTSFEAEQSLCSALREYVDTFDRDRVSPEDNDDKTVAIDAKNWTLMKTSRTCCPKQGKWAGVKKRKRQDCGNTSKQTINKRVLPGIRRSANSEVLINAAYSWAKTMEI